MSLKFWWATRAAIGYCVLQQFFIAQKYERSLSHFSTVKSKRKKARKPLSSKYDLARVGSFRCSIYDSRGSCARNECHSQRVDETALRHGRIQRWMPLISRISPEGNDVPKGEVYERSRNLGHDSIKSTLRDPGRPVPPFIVPALVKESVGDIARFHFPQYGFWLRWIFAKTARCVLDEKIRRCM